MTIRAWSNCTIVTPTAVIERGVVVAEDGLIIDVGSSPAPSESIDLRNAFLIPGLIDGHSDALENYIQPRPGSVMDPDLALISLESALSSAGITTVFHGISFEENQTWTRSLALASSSLAAISRRRSDEPGLVDHRVLHRLDGRNRDALGALIDHLASSASEEPALVSLEDHTPGQGQFSDIEGFKRVVASYEAVDEQRAAVLVAQEVEARAPLAVHYSEALETLTGLARANRIRLAAHDPTEADQVSRLAEKGVDVAEFPCTVAAAARAKELGLPVVAGAPNVLLGGSHSGNVSAVELIERGLCDVLASDYYPHGLIAAAFRLVELGVVELPSAIRLVTAGPAAAYGLEGRGRIEPGCIADLAAVTFRGGWPRVLDVWRGGSGRLTCPTS